MVGVLVPIAALAAVYMAAAFQGSWSAFLGLWHNAQGNADYWNQRATEWLDNLKSGGWFGWIPGWDTIVDTFQQGRAWLYERITDVLQWVIRWFNDRWLWWKGVFAWDDLIQAFNGTLSSLAWEIGRALDNILLTELPSLWHAVFGAIASIPQQIAVARAAIVTYVDTRVGVLYDFVTGTVITLKDYANALFWTGYNFTVGQVKVLRDEASAASVVVYDTITRTGIKTREYADAVTGAAERRVWGWVANVQGLLDWLRLHLKDLEDILTDPVSYLARKITYGAWLVLEQALVRIWDGPDP